MPEPGMDRRADAKSQLKTMKGPSLLGQLSTLNPGGQYLEPRDMVVFGPILTDGESYGLAVVETDDEHALRDFAAQDPIVTTGTAAFELGRMAAGQVRGR